MIISFLRPRKLPARYTAVIFPLVMSIMMTFIVSGIATLRNVGVTPDFVSRWMVSWGTSWIIGFPALMLVMPLVKRLLGFIVEQPGMNPASKA